LFVLSCGFLQKVTNQTASKAIMVVSRGRIKVEQFWQRIAGQTRLKLQEVFISNVPKISLPANK